MSRPRLRSAFCCVPNSERNEIKKPYSQEQERLLYNHPQKEKSRLLLQSTHASSKYSIGTAFVSHTPFSDNQNLQPCRNISPVCTLKICGLPCLLPTFTAVSISFDKCTYRRDFGINPSWRTNSTCFSPVPW